jgi:hypothetical protein
VELTSTTTQVHQQHSRQHSRRHVLLRRRRRRRCVARAAAAVLRDVLAATGPVLSRDRRRRVNGFPLSRCVIAVCLLTPVRVLSLSRHSINTHRKELRVRISVFNTNVRQPHTTQTNQSGPWRFCPTSQFPSSPFKQGRRTKVEGSQPSSDS